MPILQRLKIFQKVATGILVVFFSIMAVVTYIACLRPSGSAGIDAAKIQKIRFESHQKQIAESK
jgi:hypothetical protein